MGIYANLYDRFIGTVDSLRVNKEYRNEWLNSASVIDRTIDTRIQPDLSLPRDVSMIDAFLSSPSGQIFTNNQKSYQKMNVFSETRIPTDTFIIANTEKPTTHTPRPSNNSGKVILIGDNPQSAPGHAGRLQMETSDFVINATGVSTLGSSGMTGFAAGLLGGLGRAATTVAHNVGQNFLNNAMANVGGVAGDVLRSVGNIAVGGSLGVDQRPELMINGQYYSVILHEIQKESYRNRAVTPDTPSTAGRIGQALGQLGTSMATRAAAGLFNAGTSFATNELTSLLGGGPSVRGGNITDVLMNGTVSSEIASRIRSQLRATGESTAQHRYFINRTPDPLTGLLNSINRYWIGTETNVATALSTYRTLNREPDGGLKNRYILKGLEQLNDLFQFDNQPSIQSNRIKQMEASAAELRRFATTMATKRGIYQGVDVMNILWEEIDGVETTVLATKDNVLNPYLPAGSDRTIYDYIDVIFYNVRARNKIHVRSIISNINEKVTPAYEGTTRYIGRVEKPIVYGGVDRTLDFSIILHAFSSEELAGIWEKVNFITSLTYPQAYLNGFMIPPLAQITIGNLYQKQSGYITSLTKTVDDKSIWDIGELDGSPPARGKQLPITIKLDINFVIVDNQRYAGYNNEFHGVGQFPTFYPSPEVPVATPPSAPAAVANRTEQHPQTNTAVPDPVLSSSEVTRMNYLLTRYLSSRLSMGVGVLGDMEPTKVAYKAAYKIAFIAHPDRRAAGRAASTAADIVGRAALETFVRDWNAGTASTPSP